MDPLALLTDLEQKKWMALAILIIGYLATLCSTASTFPVNIPQRWRPIVVIVLGQGYAVLEAVSSGAKWLPAVEHGLTVSFVTLGLGALLLEAIFPNGLPKWLQWAPMLAMVPKAKCSMSLRPPPLPSIPVYGDDGKPLQ